MKDLRYLRYDRSLFLEHSLALLIAVSTGLVLSFILQINSREAQQPITEVLSFFGGFLPKRAGFPGFWELVAYGLPIIVAVITLLLLMNAFLFTPFKLWLEHEVLDLELDLKLFTTGTIVYPIAEEVIFRWLLIGCMMSWFSISSVTGVYTLLIIVSFLFTLVHLPNGGRGSFPLRLAQTSNQFLIGMILAFLYLKFGLLGVIIYHSTHNILVLSGGKLSELICRR